MKRPADDHQSMGELHLEVLVDRMLREFRVQARVGRPQVAYPNRSPYRLKRLNTATLNKPAAAASMVTW